MTATRLWVAGKAPAVFTFLGIRNETAGSVHGLHTPRFTMDESQLPASLSTRIHYYCQYYYCQHETDVQPRGYISSLPTFEAARTCIFNLVFTA